VAATRPEIEPLFDGPGAAAPAGQAGLFHLEKVAAAGHAIDVLVTGVGMVATAARCADALAAARYDLALDAGLCGSFDPAFAPGTVVHVVSERLPELGAEDGAGFLTVHDLGLADPDAAPFAGGALLNASPPESAALAALPRVNGITVNTVHGTALSIAAVVARLAPQVESMEGAAFMYACLARGVRFAEIRAVSNRVEVRNRAAWRLPEAIGALAQALRRILEEVA